MTYYKNFDHWNKRKKSYDQKIVSADFNFHEGEIWWTSIGVNIGSEIDGKHNNFERPGLIIKVISRNLVYLLPLTSKQHDDRYHGVVTYKKRIGFVIFSQARCVSCKRLLRKIASIPKSDFSRIKADFIQSLL